MITEVSNQAPQYFLADETIQLKKGDRIPITFLVDSDLLTFPQIAQTAELAQNIFIQIKGDQFAFKFNENEPWKNFGDCFTGQLTALISKEDSTSDQTQGKVHLIFNQK